MTSKADLKKKPLHPPGMLVDVPPPKAPRVPWADRVASYQRIKPRLDEIAKGPTAEKWPREKWIEHWKARRDDPNAAPYAKAAAAEALKNLGYREPRTREPGEDDEQQQPESAWHEPAEGAAGDFLTRAGPDDPLAAELRRQEALLKPQATG